MEIPAELLVHTGEIVAVDRPPQGMVFEVWILTARRGRFVLKLGRDAAKRAELEEEFRVLSALAKFDPATPDTGTVPRTPAVARPVALTQVNDTCYSLLTCVEGKNLLSALERAGSEERHQLMAEAGRALRRLHDWQPDLPRPADQVEEAVARATESVAAGRVGNPIDHSGEFNGQDPRALLADMAGWLGATPPDVVFSHGDFCLPNLLVQGGEMVGVVDWSRGGYADRRVDLAAAVWSTRHNLRDEAYVHTLLRAYGYAEPVESLRPFEALFVLW